jgi:hypothetical protein
MTAIRPFTIYNAHHNGMCTCCAHACCSLRFTNADSFLQQERTTLLGLIHGPINHSYWSFSQPTLLIDAFTQSEAAAWTCGAACKLFNLFVFTTTFVPPLSQSFLFFLSPPFPIRVTILSHDVTLSNPDCLMVCSCFTYHFHAQPFDFTPSHSKQKTVDNGTW